MSEPGLFDQRVFEVASSLARGHITAAREALGRLGDRKDTEALHDFRVAIRRLRSVLRAYRRWLGRAAGRRLRRRLGELAAATGSGRDAEVQIAWLERQRPFLARAERTGLNWMLRRRRSTKRSGWDEARRRGRDEFETLSAKLADRLGEAADVTPPLREVLGKLVRDHADALQANLANISGPDDQAAVHAARIRAKRLRYLLEPLRAGASTPAGQPGLKPLIRSLKDLQDVLGDLHDMHVLDAQLLEDLDAASTAKAHRLREFALSGDEQALRRERRRDERLGVVAVTARARARRDELFTTLRRDWIGDGEGAAKLLDAARAFADSVAPDPASSTEDPGAGRPDALPVERERKFLLERLPGIVRDAPMREIEQGWLPGQALRERLRHVTGSDGEKWFRTIKLGRGIERIEIEEETTPEVFAAMWPLTEGCRIRKRRYDVRDGDLVWEIDEFLDRDLALAEVELESVDQFVAIPDWLEAVLVREVTGEPGYLNLTLATQAA